MRWTKAVLVLLILGAVSPVWAGTLDESEYTSSFGYTVTLPENWGMVDAANYAVQLEKLPEILKQSTNKGDDGVFPFDAIFFDPTPPAETAEEPPAEAPPAEPAAEDATDAPAEAGEPAAPRASFQDSVVFVVVPAMPVIDESLGPSLELSLAPVLKTLFNVATLVSSEVSSHNGAPSFDLQWRIADTATGAKGFVWQTLIPGSSYTVLATCTIDQSRLSERKALCQSVFDSVKVN